jgi:hypothetical protein
MSSAVQPRRFELIFGTPSNNYKNEIAAKGSKHAKKARRRDPAG